jgi:hypothetical protein
MPGCAAKERTVRYEAAGDEGLDLRITRGQSDMWYNSAWSSC